MFRSLTLLTVLMLISSCSGSSGNNPEEEHLEHIIPAHQPHSYSETVDQLKLRFSSLVDGSNASVEATQELEDIITWLPDLAGDSELKKQDWDNVAQIQKELMGKFLLFKKDNKNATLKNEIDGILAKLEQLKEKSTNADSLKSKGDNSDSSAENHSSDPPHSN